MQPPSPPGTMAPVPPLPPGRKGHQTSSVPAAGKGPGEGSNQPFSFTSPLAAVPGSEVFALRRAQQSQECHTLRCKEAAALCET